MVLTSTAAALFARKGDRIPIGHINDPWDDFRLVTTFRTGTRRREGLLRAGIRHIPVSLGRTWATVL